MTPEEFDYWLMPASAPRRPLVMGILNVTPDSFSDGGMFSTMMDAMPHTMRMVEEGVDLIDVGGESTRPGASPVPEKEQMSRVFGGVRAARSAAPIVVSVDTTRAAVAAVAIKAGATMINDISAGRDDPEMLPLAAEHDVPIALMHMQGTPATMQLDPRYEDVTAEVKSFLAERKSAAMRAGVAEHRILLDPGIGFGKTHEHNLTLLRRLREFESLGSPVLVGTSRKGFIGQVTGVKDPAQRVFGTAATVAWAVTNGAAIVRVHDVGPMVQVTRMVRAILGSAV